MRHPALLLSAGAALAAGGFAGGWYAGSRSGGESGGSGPAHGVAQVVSAGTGTGEGNRPRAKTTAVATGANNRTLMTADGLSAVIAELAALSPAAYAEAMLAAQDGLDPTKRRLYLTALETSATPAQAAAFLKLYKERRGMKASENVQDLRAMLTYAGQRGGMEAVTALLAEFPDGFSELDSLIHGVALRSPQETVDWYNALPDDSKLRKGALIGMMFGIGESGTADGLKVFAQLSPEDQKECISGFSNAYCRGRGIEGADEMLAAVPVSMRSAAMTSAVQNFSGEPAKFLPWASKYTDQFPAMFHFIETSAAGFSRTSPEAAFELANAAARNPAMDRTSGILVSQLAQVRLDLAQQWLDNHPQHAAAKELKVVLETFRNFPPGQN